MDRTTTVIDMYTYPDPSWSTIDLSGFAVEATDGSIGSVDDTTYILGTDALVVDTGPWIFGTKVMVPVGAIHRLDESDRRIWLNLTKDQIRNAPEFNESRWRDHDFRDEVGSYYSANRPAGPDYGKDDRAL
jgi:hypothetical protein